MVGALLCLAIGHGCSFIWTSGPPSPCTTSYVPPIIDVFTVAVEILPAVRCSNYRDSHGENPTGVLCAGWVLLMVPSAISALVGTVQATRCRSYQGEKREIDDRARRATKLTAEAVSAARAMACERIPALGARLAALDPNIHRSVFLADPDVAGCFERLHKHDRALQLTETATFAAARANCAVVVELAATVLALDPEVHRTVFSTDRAIRVCLALAQP
jgi:hypothetical protein